MKKEITLIGLIILSASPVHAGGRYIGNNWVPEGTCYDRLKVESIAKKQYTDKVQNIEAVLNKARNQNVHFAQVRSAANSALEDAENEYHKLLQDYAPVYCSE